MDTIIEFTESNQGPFFIGIDPGATGGIGLVSSCGQGLAIDIPTATKKRKGGTKQAAVYHKIVTLFNDLDSVVSPSDVYVLLEQAVVQVPGKGNNAYTGYRVAQHYAMWPLFLFSRGYDIQEIHPSSWKAAMKLMKFDKEQTRKVALSVFPEADIKLKQDHNKAEALLLALYRKNLHYGEDPKPVRRPRH